MAQTESLKKTLHSCFSDEWISRTARSTGFVRRKGKICPIAFFWTLILGFGTGTCRTVAELRRNFQLSTGEEVVRSSFYDRFTPALCKMLKLAVAHVCANLSEPSRKLKGKLREFQDLIVLDATVITLHELLCGDYQASRTNHSKAAAKLLMVISVLSAGPKAIKVFSERSSEVHKLGIGAWVRGKLLLMDLGYYCFSLFERIDRNGGYFISRAKNNFNPVILANNRNWRGRSRPVIGKNLQDVLPFLKRQEIDFMVEVTVTRRSYRGKRSKVKKLFRLVGLLNQETGRYHLYVTNIGTSLSPEEIARTYAARWEVELLFKELKSHYQIDEIPSCKKHIVESLIYVAILTLTVSRALLFALRRCSDAPYERTPERRWAAIFQTVAARLLQMLLTPNTPKRLWESLKRFLLHEFVDPNVNRHRNLRLIGA